MIIKSSFLFIIPRRILRYAIALIVKRCQSEEKYMFIALEGTCEKIGIISDTHGLYRPEIRKLFDGVDHILHAGDIGRPPVLRELQAIAPVTAVLGNVDIPGWFPDIAEEVIVEVNGYQIIMLHNLDALDLDPKAADINIVVFGHTHKPYAKCKKDVWYINPGSTGPHRFLAPVSVAILSLEGEIAVKHYTIH